MTGMDIFEYVRAPDSYRNIYIDFQSYLLCHVSVASTERSFLKLKLLKNYLKSIVSQERLFGYYVHREESIS
jgi:hypothetical protein